MKKLRSTIVFLSVFTTLAFSFIAEARISSHLYLPPKLESFHEQAIFLSFLSRELPDLFSEGTEYDVNLFQFLRNQQIVVSFLENEPDYRSALKERSDLLEIEIRRPVKMRAKSTYVVKAELISLIIRNWKDLSSGNEENLPKYTKKAVQLASQYQDQFSGLKLKSAMTGLLSLLPPPIRAGLFRKSVLEQITQLKTSHLADLENNLSGFRFADVGLEAMTLTSLLETLESAAKKVEQIHKHLLCMSVAEYMQTAKTVENPQETLQSILIDNKAVPQAIEATNEPWLIEMWKEIQQSAGRKVGGEELPEVHRVLRLKEVPGYLATLRGFVGVDCATQFSFAYGLLPRERTFFVMDPDGAVLGYVMLTEVKWGNSKALYLHDFSGPRISPLMTFFTIMGLQQALLPLGYSAVILPTADNSHRNVNFRHIRNVIDNLVSDAGRKANITYLDEKLRLKMRQINAVSIDHTYDAPENNLTGFAIRLLEKEGLEVSTTAAVWPEVGTAPLSKTESLLLALEVDFPVWSTYANLALQTSLELTEAPNAIRLDRRRSAWQIAAQARVPQSFVDEIAVVLANYQMLDGVRYFEALDKILSTQELSLESLKRNHSHLLHPGVLNTSDVFRSPSETVNQLAMAAVRSMLLHRGQLKAIEPILERNFNSLVGHPEFDDLISDLVRDRMPNLKALQWFLSQGLKAEFFAPHLGRLQEIVLHSESWDRQAVAKKLVRKIASALRVDVDSCANLLSRQKRKKKDSL